MNIDVGKNAKNNWKRRSDGGGEKEVVTDARFASVHTDPRFQKIRTKERKVTIDPRFDKMFTDKNFGSAAVPIDKRGRRKEKNESALQRYYELKENERVRVGGLKVDDEEEEEEKEVGVRDSDESDEMEDLPDVEIDTDDDEMLIGGRESESEEQVCFLFVTNIIVRSIFVINVCLFVI